ncbi:MAG: Crp/Fnr family transcriptional regulator [Alphaproteobacteria bacterium]|nr:Crp/Fnr family transcriptional regulator [Alphaproteobacteria bacterium]
MKESIIKFDLRSNNLLRLLQENEKKLIINACKEIEVKAGTILYEPGDEVKYTYFPCNQTLVSYLVLLDDGRGVETALIGKEGAVGGIVSQGTLPAYCRSVVQFPGKLIRIKSVKLEEAKMSSVTLRHLFARYSDCLLSQIFQSVACNATHTIEQRTAKWLGMALERTGDHIIPLNQEQLAGMLGVGRSYIARVIGNFKSRGLLKTTRGKLCILSLDELKAMACECNDLVNHHFEIVLDNIYPKNTN